MVGEGGVGFNVFKKATIAYMFDQNWLIVMSPMESKLHSSQDHLMGQNFRVNLYWRWEKKKNVNRPKFWHVDRPHETNVTFHNLTSSNHGLNIQQHIWRQTVKHEISPTSQDSAVYSLAIKNSTPDPNPKPPSCSLMISGLPKWHPSLSYCSFRLAFH